MLLVVADKKAILNLRLKPETRDDFAIAAELRGASMSGLLHQFIIRTIREEKEASPQAFKTERSVNGMKLALHSKKKVPLMNRPKEEPKRKTG